MRRWAWAALAAAVAVTAWGLRSQSRWHPDWRKHVRPSPVLGWELVPSTDFAGPRGMLGPAFPDLPAAGVSRLLLLGDSFLELPALPGALTEAAKDAGRRVEFLRGGMRGYATDHYLLWYRLYGRFLKPRLVVVFWYAGNDLAGIVKTRDNQGYRKPWFTLEGGTLVPHDLPLKDPEDHPPEDALSPVVQAEWKDLLGSARAKSDRAGPSPARSGPLAPLWSAHYFLYARFPPYRLAKDALVGLWRRGDPVRLRQEAALGDLWHLRNFAYAMFAEGEDMERAWRLNDALLSELELDVRRDGGTLVVCLVPHLWQVHQGSRDRFLEAAKGAGYRVDVEAPSRRMAGWAKRSGVAFLDFTPALRAAEKDGMTYDQTNAFAHWSPLGSRTAATVLIRFLTERKLL